MMPFMKYNTKDRRLITQAVALDLCNNCDAPITHPNSGGYCDDCLEETE